MNSDKKKKEHKESIILHLMSSNLMSINFSDKNIMKVYSVIGLKSKSGQNPEKTNTPGWLKI